MEAVLETDKRGGSFSEGHDALACFTVGHHVVEQTEWNTEVEGWMRQLVEHHASYGAHGGYGQAGGALFTQGGHGDQYHGGHHGDGPRSGPGEGTAIAAGAAGLAVGVVGGMVAAEVVDEVGDFFEGDDDGDEG